MELTPHLEKQSQTPIYIQLYQYMKTEILRKKLYADEPLPSVRKLSKHLGISKTTVENTYSQLIAEGYIYSKPQKGYFVSNLETIMINDYSSDQGELKLEEVKEEYAYDFKGEYVESCNFDFTCWKKHINNVICYDTHKLFTYGNGQGELELRHAIAKYIYRTRGARADEKNIVVGAGVQPLLQILSSLLKKTDINRVAVEDPGFNRAKKIFINHEFNLLPLSVEDKGIDIDILEKNDIKLCYVSPSHQFPTGTVMLVDTRNRLINWANKVDGYIIEDDYNSELRYEGKPIPAMQGLDPYDRVIYLGSFSTVLVPSIRISFMVLPNKLMELYNNDKEEYAQTASKIEQLALSNMISSGDFDKHIRKIKKNYAKKYELTIRAIEQHLGNSVTIMGMNSGLNILLKLNNLIDEKKILLNLKKEGLLIAGISEYSMNHQTFNTPILILSYRGIETLDIEKGIQKLSKILNKQAPEYK